MESAAVAFGDRHGCWGFLELLRTSPVPFSAADLSLLSSLTGIVTRGLRGALAQASRAHAFLRGRAFVTPDDVKAIAPDVLRHRVLTTYEAEAEEVASDEIVRRILAKIESP